MRKKKRPFWLLITGLLSSASLIYLLISFPPDYQLQIINSQLSITFVFFSLLFLFVFSSVSYFLNKRRGLFLALLLIIYLILRLMKLNHPFFLIILISLFFTLNLLFKDKNRAC